MHEAPSREPEAQDVPSGCRTATPEVTRHHTNVLYRHTRYDREVFCHQAPGTGHGGSAWSTESGSRQTQKGLKPMKETRRKRPAWTGGGGPPFHLSPGYLALQQGHPFLQLLDPTLSPLPVDPLRREVVLVREDL